MNNEQIPYELINKWKETAKTYPYCDNNTIDAFNRGYVQGRKDQYLSQSSQPKGAEEVLAKEWDCEIRDLQTDIILNPDSRKILKAMHVFASQQCAEKDKEIAELKAWKESMISVTPDMQAIGRALNVPLGHSIHDKILPGIEALRDEVEYWKAKHDATANMLLKETESLRNKSDN
jgi:hypothetical protein